SPEDKPEWEDYKETETLNSMTPLWKKQKSEVTDEDYNRFYQDKFADYEAPARVIRSSTEGAATYTALMFIPKHAPYNYYTRDFEKGLQLYASGVLIMDKCADLLPDYFSFVKGLVDSQDLSLNISREMLQHDRQLKVIAQSLEKKIKAELSSMLEKDREAYDAFFKEFGLNLKYGLYADYGMHKEVLQDLVLFYSSSEKKPVTLKEYTGRMKEEQKYIYYAAGETVQKLDLLPQTELLKDKGVEILYLTDDIDEFALKALHEYDGKEFKSVSEGDLGLETEEEKEAAKKQQEDNKDLLETLKEALGDKVKEVRLSSRLKSHPACLSTEGALSLEMEKVLNAMPTEEKVKAERVLELNAGHPIFQKLTALMGSDKEKLKLYADVLYNQALLIEGMPIEDPVAYANAVCTLLQ
ncbi:MAG: molecular chaperone HtpG, partial [Oscillospiraceae bacterium]|nr:molecular chaperone HtpG [Oscillospiraceae bacterium]